MGSRSTNGAKRRKVKASANANAPAGAAAAAGATAGASATAAAGATPAGATAAANANGTATPLVRAFSRELARAGGLLSPDYLASGMSPEEILQDFPDLKMQDVKACLAFAAARERKISIVPA